jgi:hypothetical protein
MRDIVSPLDPWQHGRLRSESFFLRAKAFVTNRLCAVYARGFSFSSAGHAVWMRTSPDTVAVPLEAPQWVKIPPYGMVVIVYRRAHYHPFILASSLDI